MSYGTSLQPALPNATRSGASLFSPARSSVCPPTPELRSFEDWASAHRSAIFIVLLIGSLALAWHNRFVLDDAFISFTYARNLVGGDGLTWFGNRIEGYTNFLWVLWIAAGLLLHIDPVVWSQMSGLLAYAAALYAVWRLGYVIFGLRLSAIVSVILFATNFTVCSFATSGLETMLQTALISLLLLQYFLLADAPRVSVKRCLLSSLLAAAAILTRPDSGLPCAIILAALLVSLRRNGASVRAYSALLLPLAVIVGTWLLWKSFYYGRLLPNTFYAKVGWDVSVNVNGLVYLGRFLHWYLLWPIVVLGLAAMVVRCSWPDRRLLIPGLLVGAWFAYIIAIGGDFMEFRFLVPILPILALVVGYLIVVPLGSQLVKRPLGAAAIFIVFSAAMSFSHARSFVNGTDDRTLDSVSSLATFYGVYPDGDWTAIGKRLREELGGSNVVLAMSSAGAIPFYSGLRTIDILGLNDRMVTEAGNLVPATFLRPGHRRFATLQYLRDQKVNLVVAHPTLLPRGSTNKPGATRRMRNWFASRLPFDHEEIGVATVVAMPVDANQELLMWYLTPSPEVDRIIGERKWSKQTVTFPSKGASARAESGHPAEGPISQRPLFTSRFD
jgi:arabinofuranosyltransferase